MIASVFAFYTTGLHNSKTKCKLNKCTTEPYLINGNQRGETKNVKKTFIHICIHKYCLQSFLAEIKHLIKTTLHLMFVEKRNTNKCVKSLKWF